MDETGSGPSGDKNGTGRGGRIATRHKHWHCDLKCHQTGTGTADSKIDLVPVALPVPLPVPEPVISKSDCNTTGSDGWKPSRLRRFEKRCSHQRRFPEWIPSPAPATSMMPKLPSASGIGTINENGGTTRGMPLCRKVKFYCRK